MSSYIMIYFKNESRIKIFIFPKFLMKILNHSILDHMHIKQGQKLKKKIWKSLFAATPKMVTVLEMDITH